MILSKDTGRLTSPVSIVLAFIAVVLLFPVWAKAAPQPQKTMLIINSYNENAPWAKEMIRPVTHRVAKVAGVHSEIVHLNNILLTDSAEYTAACDNVFASFTPEDKPQYVVMIGQLAFTLRERVKEEWGDIPMLYIAPMTTYTDMEEYFGGFDNAEDTTERFPLEDLRPEFNFTVIENRYCYEETIELMHTLLPRMNRLVFISDCVSVNRYLNRHIKRYLEENYPAIEYVWLQAKESTAQALQDCFVERTTGTGLLLSSCFFQRVGVRGIPYMSMGDLSLLSGSVNPVFALRQAYMDMGAVGGVFPDREEILNDIDEVVCAMLEGKDMRDLPFYKPEAVFPVMDFRAFERYSLDPDSCPDGTDFIYKPVTFWDKYKWQILVIVLALVILIGVITWRNHDQARRIQTLERHRTFVDQMPIPYSKAVIKFNEEGMVIEMNYHMQNEAFAEILRANSYDKEGKRIFPKDFISAKVQELIDTGKPVAFTYHFDKTDTDYDFMLCMVDEKMVTSTRPKELDIFAKDITKMVVAERDLKDLTRRFDTIINLARLIPWRWDVDSDEIRFNAYSIFQRGEIDLENVGDLRETSLSQRDYFSILHPDDVEELKEIGEAIAAGRAKRFEVVYRIRIARDYHNTYREIESVGIVYDYNAEGKPQTVVGYIRMLED